MSLPPQNTGKSLSSPPPSSHAPAAASSSSNAAPSFSSSGSNSGGGGGGGGSGSGGSGNTNAGGLSNAVGNPRKGQGARKQHRNQKRPSNGLASAGGMNRGGNGGRGRRPDDDYAMAELSAIRNTNGRRGQTSITHLLNYAVPSRTYLETTYGSQAYSRSRGYGGHGHGGHGHSGHVADKARFVHANYRFIVNPNGDYTAQGADADEYLDWDTVLQILVSPESQATACPICLSETPVAPRMAKCGHVFCLPCVIRFMNAVVDDEPPRNGGGVGARTVPGLGAPSTTSSSQRAGTAPVKQQPKWKKCPICEDRIYLNEVQPVRFYIGQESPLPRPGDDVVLRLMMRHAHSTVALPREGGADVLNGDIGSSSSSRKNSTNDGIPWHFAASVLDYSRIMKGTGDYMVEQFDREIEDIGRQEREDELLFHEDNEWTQKAVRAVRTAQGKARELGGLEVALQSSGGRGNTTNAADTPSSCPAQDFFFYMSPPHLYLSPLDIRILKTKYGDFSSFPSTLLPRVEHISMGHVVDDAMRKRARYLGHLPAGCVVSFLECDWTDIVPADILAQFAADIEARRNLARTKAAREERDRVHAERRLEAAGGLHKGRRVIRSATASATAGGGPGADGPADSGDFVTFPPAVDINDFQPLGYSHVHQHNDDDDDGDDDDEGALSSSPPQQHRPQTGFAHLASMSTSPSTGRTVWGTRAVATSPQDHGSASYYVDDVDDGWLKADQVVGLGGGDGGGLADDLLAAQLQSLGVEVDAAGDGGGASRSRAVSTATAAAAGPAVSKPSEGGASKKKKKKQKITLMSTGGRRGL